MIQFDFDKHCYGCENCVNACPVDAITMKENREGFLVPQVDLEKCIQCGACDRSCIYLQENSAGTEKTGNVSEKSSRANRSGDGQTLPGEECYALYGSSDERALEQSASGGVFPALAKYFIKNGGYVCGCIWNDKVEAVHVVSNDSREMEKMLHSKYTQSRMGNVYKETKKLLDAGKKVLFSGTPCQIAAVLRFTGNPQNLYTCDVICKGVPSPGVWNKYKEYLQRESGSALKSVILRGKHRYGWNGPVTKYEFENGSRREDLFFQLNHYIVGFLDGLYMRNSCYECQYKDRNHKADIVLGDFWGINRSDFKKSRNKGVSAVIVRTNKGKELFEQIRNQFVVNQVTYEEMVEKNPSMTGSTPHNPKREKFFAEFETTPIEMNIAKHTDLLGKKKRLIRVFYKTGLFSVVKWWKTKMYKG